MAFCRPPDQADGLPCPVPRGRERVRWNRWAACASVGSDGSDGRPPKRAVAPAGRPIGRPRWPTARSGGRGRPPSDWAALVGTRRPHGRPPCSIRPSVPLPLSLFFSPLQFTLEWIRSGFGWTKSIHWLLIFGRKKMIL